MAEEITECHVRIGEGIGEMEELNVRAHEVVPAHLPLVYQHANGGGGECLGGGADCEEGLGSNGIGLAEFAYPMPLQVDHLIATHDGYRRTGHLPSLQRFLDDGIDLTARDFAAAAGLGR